MDTKKQTAPEFAETIGGRVGAALPLLTMLAAMLILSISGLRSTQNYWCAGFLGILVAWFVYKDKQRFQKALVAGVSDQIFCTMVPIFLLSGVLSKILTASHLVDGLLWLASQIHLSTALVPLLCFIVAILLSSATGSCAGTITAVIPIMLPLAVSMGCNPGLVCGATLAGGAFGDNLAPISDTTIASSLTQEVDVSRVVRSRFKYSITGGIPTAIIFLVLGFVMSDPTSAETLAVDSNYASSLIFLAIPVLIVVMMLMKANFFTAILVGELVGAVMLLLFGYVDFPSLFATDGIIVTGFSGMLNTIIFMMFIFALVSITRDVGILQIMQDALTKRAKSDTSAEVASGIMVSLTSIMIGSGTSAISFCGPIIRDILRPLRIDRARAANFLDGLGCGVGYLIPYSGGPLLLASLAVATGVVAESFSPTDFIFLNFYSYALIIVYWVAIFTGWGRKHETDEELAADGIYLDTPAD